MFVYQKPRCLNRYYVAEGVKLYSHETWRLVTGMDGKYVFPRCRGKRSPMKPALFRFVVLITVQGNYYRSTLRKRLSTIACKAKPITMPLER